MNTGNSLHHFGLNGPKSSCFTLISFFFFLVTSCTLFRMKIFLQRQKNIFLQSFKVLQIKKEFSANNF